MIERVFFQFVYASGVGGDFQKAICRKCILLVLTLAWTVLIAESKAVEKDTICKVVVNLINRENL